MTALHGRSEDPLEFREPVPLSDLAARFGGEVVGSDTAQAIRPIATAGAGELAPYLDRRHRGQAQKAAAMILTTPLLARDLGSGPPALWLHPMPMLAMARLLTELARAESAKAAIDPTATVAPSAVLYAGCTLGPACRIEPGAVIYPRVRLGKGVVVGAGSVIGREGFGFTADEAGDVLRIPQLGGVELDDDVEVGPLCTIDAGTLSPTRIRRGVKMDAQVHVGHNADIGEGTFIAAQSGIAGSTVIGRGCRLGGQVGVADHLSIGEGSELAARAGVITDLPRGARVAGYPAVDKTRWLKSMARLLRRANKPK